MANDTLAVPGAASILSTNLVGVDHIAIAVSELESSLTWFTKTLGFELKERRTTEGKLSGMISAVLTAGPLTVVLLQGTSPESQIEQFISVKGQGVQHIALAVRDLARVVEDLKSQGMEFETTIVGGDGLRQIFSKRDVSSGIMLELLERNEKGFSDQNVAGLFEQLESNGSF